ncbi:MAG: ABC transporter substrate-binding protein [Acidobacteriota bacterium]
MKRRFRILSSYRSVCLTALAAVMLACSGCAPRQKPGVEIEFWTLQLSPAFDDYFHTLIRTYERAHPGVTVRWVDVPYDAAIQKLMASAAAGNAPDCVNLSADFLAKFHGMGALADLTTDVKRAPFTYLPNALELCTFDHRIEALPWYLNTYILIYNRSRLEEGGFTREDLPTTFGELVRFIRRYKERTGKFAAFWNIGKDSYLPMMLESEGVMMADSSLRHAAFNSERGIALVDEWVRLYRDGCLQSESIMKPGSMIVESYQSGQTAMMFTGPVFLRRIKTNAPSIYRSTDVAPVVTGRTGKHELAAMAVSVLSTSKHRKEAAEFALFLTNPENQLAFAKLTTTYPSVKEAYRDTFFTRGDGTLEARGRVLGARELPSAGRLRAYLQHPEFDRLRDAFDEAIQHACLGTMTTKEALDRAASEWNDILSSTPVY